jgi:hypothetical protein
MTPRNTTTPAFQQALGDNLARPDAIQCHARYEVRNNTKMAFQARQNTVPIHIEN